MKNILLHIILILVLVLNFSCKKEERSFELFPFEVTKVEGNYECTWQKAEDPDFEKYQLFVSSSPIPPNIKYPSEMGPSAIYAFNISDPDLTFRSMSLIEPIVVLLDY